MRKSVAIIIGAIALFVVGTGIEALTLFSFLNNTKTTPECKKLAEHVDLHRTLGWTKGDQRDLIEASILLQVYNSMGCDPKAIYWAPVGLLK